jgi:hypothetical protein
MSESEIIINKEKKKVYTPKKKDYNNATERERERSND